MILFELGIPQATGTTFSPYGPYSPTQPGNTQFVFAGDYGPTAIVWYNDIRAPNTLDFALGDIIGVNTQGVPLVVSYDKMVWGYSRIRPDEWYYLRSLFRLTRRGNNGNVRVRFPQPSGVVECSAVWEQLTQSSRTSSGFENISLTFSQLARYDDIPPEMVWQPMQ